MRLKQKYNLKKSKNAYVRTYLTFQQLCRCLYSDGETVMYIRTYQAMHN